MEKFEIVVTTLFGLEEVLASELKTLGAENIELLNRAVRIRGDAATLYRCNLNLRTAVKVLTPIASFCVNNEKQLYDSVMRIDWGNHLSYRQTFAIDASVYSEVFTHSKYVALKTKDAIADQFRNRHGIRPSVDTENPDIRVNIHIHNRDVVVSLDSSGTPLGIRNYKRQQTEASMSEVLAAGIILLTGWDKRSDFIDPMCGSGTFPIEAAMLAGNMAPGRNRRFGFESWSNFDAALWGSIKAEAEAQVKPCEAKIFAMDIDNRAVDIAMANAQRAGVKGMISFDRADFFGTSHGGGQGLVIMNPPYGERLQLEEIARFYNDMGSRLKHFYGGCDAWVISANHDALKSFGLRPSRKLKLYNGQLECRLQKFELYPGSKRARNQEKPTES